MRRPENERCEKLQLHKRVWATLVALNLLFCTHADANVIVAHDVNTFALNFAGGNEATFAVNAAQYIIGNTTGSLLLYESSTDPLRNYSSVILDALSTAGFSVTVTGDYTTPFASFDAIFVSQDFPTIGYLDNQEMIDFVDSGGGVYLTGGVGLAAQVEADGWNTFLNEFGLAFISPYNNFFNVPITSGHVIFDGVSSLNSGIGNPIINLGTYPTAQIVQTFEGSGVYAVVDIPDIVPDPTTVPFDIKPGGDVNPINLKSNGVLSTAILSTNDFDVSDINVSTLLFGDPLLLDDNGIGVSPLRYSFQDVSHDGLMDLSLKFSMRDAVDYGALGPDTIEGLITGELFDGTLIEGLDSIRIVPPNGSNGSSGANGSSIQVSAIPEPSTLTLAACALLGLIGRRQRGR